MLCVCSSYPSLVAEVEKIGRKRSEEKEMGFGRGRERERVKNLSIDAHAVIYAKGKWDKN